MKTYKNDFILDPTWIKKGIIDQEYQHYILLAAKKKFTDKLEEGNTESLYELMFHYLNLNGLILNNFIYDIRLNRITRDEQLDEVMYQIKKRAGDAPAIAREANIIFSKLIIRHLTYKSEILRNMKLLYNNPNVHMKDPIYIILHIGNSDVYDVWKLKIDKRYNFGYSISKVEDFYIPDVEDRIVERKIIESNNKHFDGFNSDTNVICATTDTAFDPKEVALTVKDILLLNKLFMNVDAAFDPNVLAELRDMLKFSTVPIPLTLTSFF